MHKLLKMIKILGFITVVIDERAIENLATQLSSSVVDLTYIKETFIVKIEFGIDLKMRYEVYQIKVFVYRIEKKFYS